MANKTLNELNPDLQALVDELTARLRSSDAWKDVITSSTGQTLIEFIAATGTMIHYNLERQIPENFISTALTTNGIMANSIMLGVNPRRNVSARTMCTLRQTGDSDSPLSVPPRSQFLVGNVHFYNPAGFEIPANSDPVNDILLVQGRIVTDRETGTGAEFQEYETSVGGFQIAENFQRYPADDVTFEGQVFQTNPIAFNVSATNLQAALNEISRLNGASVTVATGTAAIGSKARPWIVSLPSGANPELVSANADGLVGGDIVISHRTLNSVNTLEVYKEIGVLAGTFIIRYGARDIVRGRGQTASGCRVVVGENLYRGDAKSLFGYRSGDRVFLEKVMPDGKIRLSFPSRVNGEVPDEGEEIVITYAVSEGADANTAAVNQPVRITGISGAGRVEGNTTTAVSGGVNAENPELIRHLSPRLFAAAERAVRRDDWRALALRFNRVELADAQVWGEYEEQKEKNREDNTLMNSIKIALLPTQSRSAPQFSIGSGDGNSRSFGTEASPIELPASVGKVERGSLVASYASAAGESERLRDDGQGNFISNFTPRNEVQSIYTNSGTNEVQRVFRNADVTSGTFTLKLGSNGIETEDIPYNANAAKIETELNKLSGVTVKVTGTGESESNAWVIEFLEPGRQDVVALVATPSNIITVNTATGGQTGGTFKLLSNGKQNIYAHSAVTGGTFTLTYDGQTTDANNPIPYRKGQKVYRANSVTGGTFTLTYKGQTTAPIPWNGGAGKTLQKIYRNEDVTGGLFTLKNSANTNLLADIPLGQVIELRKTGQLLSGKTFTIQLVDRSSGTPVSKSTTLVGSSLISGDEATKRNYIRGQFQASSMMADVQVEGTGMQTDPWLLLFKDPILNNSEFTVTSTGAGDGNLEELIVSSADYIKRKLQERAGITEVNVTGTGESVNNAWIVEYINPALPSATEIPVSNTEMHGLRGSPNPRVLVNSSSTAAEVIDRRLENLSTIDSVAVPDAAGTQADPWLISIIPTDTSNYASLTYDDAELTPNATDGTLLTVERTTATLMEEALQSLSNITQVTVNGLGTANTPWVVDFLNPNLNLHMLIANDDALTGSNGLTIENGEATVDIPFNATPETIKRILVPDPNDEDYPGGLSNIKDVSVTGAGISSNPWRVTFRGAHSGHAQVPFTIDKSGLTPLGENTTAEIEQVVAGRGVGSGTINYETGAIWLTFAVAPDSSSTVTANYDVIGISESDKAEFIQHMDEYKPLATQIVIQDAQANVVDVSVDVFYHQGQEATAVKQEARQALSKVFERKLGLLGKDLHESDIRGPIDRLDSVDYVTVRVSPNLPVTTNNGQFLKALAGVANVKITTQVSNR